MSVLSLSVPTDDHVRAATVFSLKAFATAIPSLFWCCKYSLRPAQIPRGSLCYSSSRDQEESRLLLVAPKAWVGGFANRVFSTILRGNKNPAAIITALEPLTICKQTVFVIPKSISFRSIARHLFVLSDCRNLENPPLAIAVHLYFVCQYLRCTCTSTFLSSIHTHTICSTVLDHDHCRRCTPLDFQDYDRPLDLGGGWTACCCMLPEQMRRRIIRVSGHDHRS